MDDDRAAVATLYSSSHHFHKGVYKVLQKQHHYYLKKLCPPALPNRSRLSRSARAINRLDWIGLGCIILQDLENLLQEYVKIYQPLGRWVIHRKHERSLTTIGKEIETHPGSVLPGIFLKFSHVVTFALIRLT